MKKDGKCTRGEKPRKKERLGMKGKCDLCGHDPETVRAALRRDLVTCEGGDSGKTYCTKCQVEMAISKNHISVFTRNASRTRR